MSHDTVAVVVRTFELYFVQQSARVLCGAVYVSCIAVLWWHRFYFCSRISRSHVVLVHSDAGNGVNKNKRVTSVLFGFQKRPMYVQRSKMQI